MQEENVIKAQIELAPKEIKDLLKKAEWVTVVEKVVEDKNLLNNQKEILENELLFVILGLEPKDDLIDNIKINVGLTENVAVEIVRELQEKILKNISHLLPNEAETESPALPMVEKGEVAHVVPHVEVKLEKPKPIASIPDYRYPSGNDPYRESLG